VWVEEGAWAGEWHWVRSPDQERRVVAGLYNRYCLRCHGVDGRGVWDMPDVPNFADARWQMSRTDGQLARLIIEGRGAVMPAFRGTLTVEQAWAMARYLRTFVPGAEVPRPDFDEPEQPKKLPQDVQPPPDSGPTGLSHRPHR
jgi:mono/diheme cytochrome c family protein